MYVKQIYKSRNLMVKLNEYYYYDEQQLSTKVEI